ncbi:MAG: pyruvate kinase [Verrucomicrobiales bacterium]|jgi:pyruvate kinase
MRKTKIICTLGPATESEEQLAALIAAGANVFRLNMSHARVDWVRRMTVRIREQAAAASKHVGILMDLQGPSIRTGDLPEPLMLAKGDSLELTLGDVEATQALSTSVNYPGLDQDLSVGDEVLVDNGVIHLRVLEIGGGRISTEVLTPGKMGSRRHINLPGIRVRMPSLTEKDRRNVTLAAELQLDFVALSFVREREAIDELRALLEGHGCKARVVAKMEDQQAVTNIEEIVTASDVVMVARGDLGVEVHIEEMPILQRLIVKKCVQIGRQVIVATQMLESMIENPIPTRAEVTDVANAVFEQASAVMLSGETSIGKYPVECVENLDKIARRTERSGGVGFAGTAILKTNKQKTVRAAVVLADSIQGSKILVLTKRGVLANYVAHLRPEHSPIFAFAPDPAVCRRLALNRGVLALDMEFGEEGVPMVDEAIRRLKEAGLVKKGDPVVVLSDVLNGEFVVDSVWLKTLD